MNTINIAVTKYGSEEERHVAALAEIDSVLKEATKELLDAVDECGIDEVNPIEFRSRDGFIPHSFNFGGYGAHTYESVWSGNGNNVIQTEIDKILDYVHSCGVEEFGEGYDPGSNSDHEDFEQSYMEEYSNYLLECRSMFHGFDEDSETYSVTFSLIARVSDAPYFRYADWYVDFEITFKTAEELRQKIKDSKMIEVMLKDYASAEETITREVE